MPNKSYHHGNLKHALIEAGIEIINEKGEAELSLRKVAAKCGVTSGAPYAHFANKQEMIIAMQNHVTECFMESLCKAADPLLEKEMYGPALIEMGRAYVLFFLEHPAYFGFLFSQPCMKANLSVDKFAKDDFPPYRLLRDTIKKWCDKENKLSDENLEIRIIRMWSSVHGVAAIAMMKNVRWDRGWEEEINKIID